MTGVMWMVGWCLGDGDEGCSDDGRVVAMKREWFPEVAGGRQNGTGNLERRGA
ncbi:hypothetical protein Tco_0385393, partial [Tanacetum coccineum]